MSACVLQQPVDGSPVLSTNLTSAVIAYIIGDAVIVITKSELWRYFVCATVTPGHDQAQQ